MLLSLACLGRAMRSRREFFVSAYLIHSLMYFLRTSYISSLPTILPVELWGRVIDEMPLLAMYRLALTCKAFRELVYRQLPFNIRARYRAFVQDVDGLMEIMEKTCAVAFGSFVASIISGAPHWEPQNIDFIVNGGHRATAIFSRFLYRNGYTETVIPFNQALIAADEKRHSYDIRRIFYRYSDNAQVTLFNCTAISTAYVLLNSYSTLSFQYITPSYLCCAYPFLTLYDNALLNPRLVHERSSKLLWERYDKRGWDHWTYGTDASKYAKGINRKFLCPHRLRFVGDAGCLIMPLTRKDTWTTRAEFLLKHAHLAWHGVHWMMGGMDCPLDCGSDDEFTVRNFFGTVSPDCEVFHSLCLCLD